MARTPIGKRAMTSTERARRRRTRLHKEKLVQARLDKTQSKRDRRQAREVELAAATVKASQLLGAKLYGVLYVDPPWRFLVHSRETGLDRGADNHYPTMTLAELMTLKLPAAKDCVLFMWATIPQLGNAQKLLEHFGFGYKSHHVWVKPDLGTGYWMREQHELLLIATRGEVPCPAPGMQFPSVIEAPRGEHSEKPAIVAEMIERYFPNVPRLEMFARAPREDWDVWGNEVMENKAGSTL
jgi:N6-adenosine-specific RNA methylase IME4